MSMKKFSAGAWVAVVSAVLAVVSTIVYACNIGGAGYFKSASVGGYVAYTLLAAAALLCAAALKQVKTSGIAATCVDVLSGAMQIVAPVLLALALINVISARVEGLGFIYFSNADVILEVQTAANMSSAHGAIANMVVNGVAAVMAMVSAFLTPGQKK